MVIQPIDIGLIIAYIVIVIGLGIWSARKQSPDEFLIHGRRLKTFAFIATVSASWVGGGAIVGYGAYVYEFGIASIALYLGVFVSLLYFTLHAPKIRREGHKLEHLTLADYFHLHSNKNAGMTATVVLTIVLFLFIVNQLIAGTTVLSSLSGWTYETALFICAVVVLVYLLLGGMKSVVKTDVFQYLSMVLLVIVLGVIMVRKTGVEPELLDVTRLSPTLAIAFTLYGLFIPLASAEIWQRVYATNSDKDLRHGLIGAGVCILIVGGAITLLALAARTAYPNIDPKEAIPYGMAHLLPAGLLGLGLVVLFAAIMSTTDTLIFYLSSSVAKDYYGQIKKVSKEDLQRITKTFIIVITTLTVACAYVFRDLIAVLITIAGVQASLVPPILASFYMKLKPNAVIAALVSSCVYVAILVLMGQIVPEYAMFSLFISAFVLAGWQKFGK